MSAISRNYLHNAIGAADVFLSHSLVRTDQATAALVKEFIAAAASLDGRLCELADDKKAANKHPHVLRSNCPWLVRWVGSSQTFHKGDSSVTIKLEQQVLENKKTAKFIGTQRYRVSVGDDPLDTQYTSGHFGLRKLLKSVLRDLGLTDDERAVLLEGFFG